METMANEAGITRLEALGVNPVFVNLLPTLGSFTLDSGAYQVMVCAYHDAYAVAVYDCDGELTERFNIERFNIVRATAVAS